MIRAEVRRRDDAAAILVLILIITALFADVLAGQGVFYLNDTGAFYAPMKHVLRDIVRGGEMPYWNPFISGGQPLAANPEHEVFYPLTWLILLPSYVFGFHLLIIVHLYIAALTMYALLRSMELGPSSALLGGLAFAIGGVTLSDVCLLPELFCTVWLPLTCLFARRFLLRRSARDLALATLSFGLQCLIGEPTTLIQTGLLLGAYALYRGWYSMERLRACAVNVLWVGLMSLGAFLVAAVQLIPAVDLVRESARARPFPFDLVKQWSMPWAKLLELVYPHVLGHTSYLHVQMTWASRLYPQRGLPFLQNIYPGLLLTLVVLASLFTRPRGGRFVFIIMAASVLLAVGDKTPLLRFLYDRGIANVLRYPEKFVLMAVFVWIVFAARMIDELLAGDGRLRKIAVRIALVVTSLAAALYVFSITPTYASLFAWIWQLRDPGHVVIGLSSSDWLVAAIRGLAVAALINAATKWRLPVWTAAAVTLMAIDLGTLSLDIAPRLPRRYFDPPEAAKALPVNRTEYRVFFETEWHTGDDREEKKYLRSGEGVYWVMRNGLMPVSSAGSGLETIMQRDYDRTALLKTADFNEAMVKFAATGNPHWAEPLMAMSNAWFRARYRPFDEALRASGGDITQIQPIIFQRALRWPRFYFADRVIHASGVDDFVAKLNGLTYGPAVAFINGVPFIPARGSVRSTSQTANHVRIDVESSGRAILVMSITPHKYWHVAIDGQPVTPITVNVGYQGIILPAGRHIVTMNYSNDLIPISAIVSSMTMLLLGVIALRRRSAT